ECGVDLDVRSGAVPVHEFGEGSIERLGPATVVANPVGLPAGHTGECRHISVAGGCSRLIDAKVGKRFLWQFRVHNWVVGAEGEIMSCEGDASDRYQKGYECHQAVLHA